MKPILISSALFCIALNTHSQVVNGGFEDGSLVMINPVAVKPAEALPGWNALSGGTPLLFLGYNAPGLDSAWVSIHDNANPNDLFKPIGGTYSVFIKGATPLGPSLDAEITQVVAVPSDSKSLFFRARNLNGLDLSFNGQNLTYYEFQQGGGDSAYGADISGFAGSTGEIRFTAGQGEWGLIDDVLFSTIVIPEPSVMGLSAGGLAFLLLATRLKRLW
jgi:hypothetical protein